MQRDGDYTVSRDPLRLLTPEILGQRAGKRVAERLEPRDIASQRCAIILEAPIAHQLFDYFLESIRGTHLYKRASWLCDSLNQAIFPEWINLIDQPHLVGALGSLPFDQEGVAITDRSIIEYGRLCRYLLSSYTARQLGMSLPEHIGYAGGVRNLCVRSKQSVPDLQALLHEMGRGLLITELLGHGFSVVTGDYSQGAFGYWVEDGQIQYPVHRITIAGNLRQMLKKILCIAQDTDLRHRVRVGSILIDDVSVAGYDTENVSC